MTIKNYVSRTKWYIPRFKRQDGKRVIRKVNKKGQGSTVCEIPADLDHQDKVARALSVVPELLEVIETTYYYMVINADADWKKGDKAEARDKVRLAKMLYTACERAGIAVEEPERLRDRSKKGRG